MFSGIVTNLIKAQRIKKTAGAMEVTLPIPGDWKLTEGESVNIDGVCSTVKSLDDKNFSVYYMPATLKVTNLSEVSDQHEFNLERSLTLNSLVGGHLVVGHVDCVGLVANIKNEGEAKVLTINLPKDFAKYLIYKGSVAVNGVSLTVVKENKDNFIVSLIPYTLAHTNLGTVKVGSKVNIEVDLMAKYLEKLIQK
ncbi:MAG: riboflavin synthase [Candidatus Daviesbacteria bacterium]|nr:riboflavin synthase [Candidatus Daviesbacteria bacterium]